jgi:HK97 family phage major capsid protein
MDKKIQELEALKEKLHSDLQALLAADEVDEAKVAGIKAQFEKADADIEKRTKMLAMADELEAKIPKATRKVQEDGALEVRGGARVAGGDTNGARPGAFGYRHLGEYSQSIIKAGKNPRAALIDIDPRLDKLYNASLTSWGSEGIGSDGGYAVPPDFRADILKKLQGEDALLGYTQQINTGSNSVTLPIDEVTPWDTGSGVLTYWAGEAAAITQSKPALQNTTIRAEKLTALVPVGDELLSDAPALTSWLMGKALDKLNYKVNDAIVNGTGVGMPSGILQAGGLVTQPAEGGQTAGTVVFNNVTKMFGRMRDVQRRNAIWLANQDIEPQLQAMVVPGSSPSIPAYLPAGGLSTQKYAMLMGRPIVYTEATKAIGTVGDLILCDMDTYLTVVKGGGVRSDMSIHLWFDQDVTAFRWILRIGGQGLWKTTITRPGAKQVYGSFIALAAR